MFARCIPHDAATCKHTLASLAILPGNQLIQLHGLCCDAMLLDSMHVLHAVLIHMS